MELLTPNWQQPRPTPEQIRSMCQRVQLSQVPLSAAVFEDVLTRLRQSHRNGGAFLSAFHVAVDDVFDWFASRNRLLEDCILASLLSRPEIREKLPELLIPVEPEQSAAPSCADGDVYGFKMESSFLFDGRLAWSLYQGGAYWQERGDGRAEKELALSYCEAAFALRFSELRSYVSHAPWTRWFGNIAWDWTSVLFDLRFRNLWILAVTDTD